MGSASSTRWHPWAGTRARGSRSGSPWTRRGRPSWAANAAEADALPRLTPVYRRAWTLMVALAVGMAVWAIVLAIVLDKRLVDPEGSFLGPSYIRLPLLLAGALLLDLLPLTIWRSWRAPRTIPSVIRARLRTHWTRERWTLVALGITCFYVV